MVLNFAPISIGLDEVQIWTIPLDQPNGVLTACKQVLSPDEMARARRFVTEQLQQRFIVCRGYLRLLLAAATGMEANDLEFTYEKWGKPKLASPTPQPLDFNVSHSQGYALIAMGPASVGVDLEIPNPRINPRALVTQVMHRHEQSALDSIPPRSHATEIMRLWVCKEALLKALGLGIAEGLLRTAFPVPIPTDERFSPSFIDAGLAEYIDDDGTCRSASWIDPETWRLQMLQPLPDCFAAVAVQPYISKIKTIPWALPGE